MVMNRKVLHDAKDYQLLHTSFNREHFSFDTETTSLRYYDLKITGMSLCDGDNNYYLPITDTNRFLVMGLMKGLFDDAKKIIAHHWVFDAKVLNKYGIIISERVKVFDTRIASHLLNENDQNGLKHLTRTILGREVEDFNINLSHYCEEFYEYALDDSLNTWLLYEHFLPIILSDKGIARLFFKVEMPFQKVLLEMELEGVTIDQQKLLSITTKVKEAEQQFTAKMLDIAKIKYSMQFTLTNEATVVSPVNFGSPLQLRKFLFETIGIKPSGFKTGTGNDTTGKELIDFYRDGEDENHMSKFKTPIMYPYSKYKIASKIHSMYKSLPSHIQGDGKLRASFNDTGTKTGRMSCSNINLQQLPKLKNDFPVAVREVFIAPKGYTMITCDYSGQEIAVAAQQSKDPTLVESLNKRYDMHLAIANQFYNLGIPTECLNKSHPKYKGYKAEHGKSRSRAKTITFGLMYGKGAYGFAKDFGISEDEAQKIVDDYFKGMPQLLKAITKAHKELELTGTVTTMAGRKRHFVIEEGQQWQLEKAKRQAFNFLIQGFSADMIRGAMVNVYRRKKRYPEWDLKTVMTVHDEAVYIVKKDYVKEASNLIKQSFEDTAKNFVVPVEADIGIGPNYEVAK